MKTAKEWMFLFDEEDARRLGPNSALARPERTDEEKFAAIQADALEAAVLAVDEMAKRPADSYPMIEGKFHKTFTLADIREAIRKLKETP